MHEQRTLRIRNPDRPGREVLPTRLDITELQPRWQRMAAIKSQAATVEAEREAAKAKAKARLDELEAEAAALWKEIESGEADRTIECEYGVDLGEGFMYVLRLDTMQVVRRRALTKHEKQQPDLFLANAPTRTVDVWDDIPTVRRFDSDTPDVGQEEEKPKEAAAPAKAEGDNGHEHSFNEGACVTCGDPEPASDDGEAGPKKKGKKGGKGKGYDTRAAAH